MAQQHLTEGHFQLFALDERSAVRWRLLSANNRELGRGYAAHTGSEACIVAIAAMLERLDDLVAQTRRRDGNLWRWALVADEVLVVVGGHGYDRQIRSEEAAGRFRAQAHSARINTHITLTGARRWARAATGRPILPHR
jgi:hypothetical protein